MVVAACIFLADAPKWVTLAVFMVYAAFGVWIPWIDAQKHEALFKSVVVALFTLSILLIGYMALEASGVLERVKNVEGMIALIRSFGFWGVFVYVLFIVLNVVFLPVPAAVPAVIGTAVFGPLWSFVCMSAGTVAGSLIIFILGRNFGKKLVVWMIGKEKTEKYAEFVGKKGRAAFIFMIVLPFFPDDILCLMAGLSHMSYRYFIFVICPVRVATLAFMCFFADGKLIPFHGWGLAVWIAIGTGLIGAFVAATVIKRKILKAKKV